MRNRKYPSHCQPVCQQQLAATMLFVGDLKVTGMPDCINNEYVASKLSKTIYNADFCYYIKQKLQFVEFVSLSSLKFTLKWQSKSLDWCCCKELILDSVTKLLFLKTWCCGLNRVKTEQDVVKWLAAQATAHVGIGNCRSKTGVLFQFNCFTFNLVIYPTGLARVSLVMAVLIV